ncbi:MAG: ATP-dependent Clp protease proteolytic subunit [Nitrospirae bacterium]|nr:ATP-dependent Clp protease proteolytic subunit [Nitrospirota bacterium]
MPNWKDALSEIQRYHATHAKEAKFAVDVIRRKYLKQLHRHTGLNIIAYYSGFLSKPEIQSDINDEDKNGFMMAIHKMERAKGLDLILHTPGGSISATQSLVDYLHKMFNDDIRALVPQMAMSAGTMIACSCKSILMGKHSNLGPIDPHLNGIPAYGVVSEFQRACEEVKNDPSRVPIWQQIISQYRPAFLSQCENAITWSNEFVREQLEAVMFKGEATAKRKAEHIVKHLADYTGNKSHSRHIPVEECERIGLKIERVEADPRLQDLLLTVHHCFMHSLMNTNSYKMIENHLGSAFVKQAAMVVQPVQA